MTLHPMRTIAVPCTALAVALAAAPAVAQARSAPTVEQMVVFKSGRTVVRTVKASGVQAKVGARRCAVGTGTPLAALLRSKVARLGLRDYASCGRAAADGGQIYVRSIGSDTAKGSSGWVYKVGNRSATSGAADTTGPFGSGLLRSRQRITWYYGTQRGDSFQRTLTVKVASGGAPGTARATVRSYDNEGRGRVESGVSVVSGAARAVTDATGSATLTTGAGSRSFVASKAGLIRSFPEKATVR